AREGEAPYARIIVAEADELGPIEAGEPHQHAVETCERLVAVARYRTPQAEARRVEPRPAPLVLVPVPVADQDVHQAGGEVGPGVDTVAGMGRQVLEQLLGAGQVDRTHQRPAVGRSCGWPLP